jgi:hypothetical protein
MIPLPKRLVAIEGVIIEIVNTPNATNQERGRFRTGTSMIPYFDKVPEDMRNVNWTGLNMCHQTKQGACGKTPS